MGDWPTSHVAPSALLHAAGGRGSALEQVTASWYGTLGRVDELSSGEDRPERRRGFPARGGGALLVLGIQLAWNLPNEQFLVGPKWLETRVRVHRPRVRERGPNANVQQDEDIARRMLQALLVERFQMKYHMEDRPMTAFNIRADNPKMTKADPAKRTRCFEGAPPGSPAAARAPQFGRQVTCQNITMAQFGAWLPSIAGGYTQVPAVDMTGLEGGYDFTLDFSPIGWCKGRGPKPGNADARDRRDRSDRGAVTARRREAAARHPAGGNEAAAAVLVIDSMNEKPTEQLT